MANILLISVQEDAPRTQALAQRFRATGFSVREGVSSDAALRSAAVGILLWSQESRQAPLFQDTARRVVSAGKAVVARLTDTLPAEGFGMLRAFDLSGWRGDPHDPLLDKLHDTVRQMVVRDLCAQAEHWRSIAGGGDASALSEYLTRYGPEGAFAALAQWRLHRLAGGEARAEPRPAAQARGLVASPAPRPSPNRAMAPAPSRVIDAAGRDVSDERGSLRRKNSLSRLRGAMIMTMIPFLVGVALGGVFSVPGFGGSTILLGPAETHAAPIEARARPRGAPAPATLASVPEAWLSALALLREAESEPPVPAAAVASAEYVPAPTMSWNRNDATAESLVLAAAPLTPEPVSPLQSDAEAASRNAPREAVADSDAVRASDPGQDVAALIQEGMALILKVDDVRSELSRLEAR